MSQRIAVIACVVLTILFSIPFLIAMPSVAPFLSADVRHAAPEAVSQLRERGIWLVNATFDHIERHDDRICFVWKHAYRSRSIARDPEFLTTCIDEEE